MSKSSVRTSDGRRARGKIMPLDIVAFSAFVVVVVDILLRQLSWSGMAELLT
jgi:hypothetical protein